MLRTLIAYAPAAVVVALMWMRLESPAEGVRLALWLALLALLPALAKRWWTRTAGYLGAAALAVGSALEVSPLDLPRVGERVAAGVVLFYDERLPVTPAEQPDMAGALLLATFFFCIPLALAVRARRPLSAAVALLVGAGWPATLLPGGADLARGALILGAALLLLAALRRAAVRQALVAGAAVLVAAVGASTSGAVDRSAILAWEDWDVYDAAPEPVGVSFIWEGRYAGIKFPKKKTTVLTIKAGPQPTYWRATTLDDFDGRRWVEDGKPLAYSGTRDGRDELGADEMMPRAARNPDTWRKQVVTVQALRDDHLIGGSVPVAYGDAGLDVSYRWGGVARINRGGLRQGMSYTVWSYQADPKPRALLRLGPDYPAEGLRRGRYLRPDARLSVSPFGTPGRDRTILAEFESGFFPRAYEPLYRTARRVVGSAPTPYAAVVALESWFRRNGGFVYDEQPGTTPGAPPLVDFLERKRGYCQHFAGAMTLMLRYLGIPSRVAVGFTSGEYDDRTETWKVTDHDGHAWVEVWFPKFGWLPFDPTPSRGRLSGGYTSSSREFAPSPDVLEALGGGVAAELLRRERLQGLRGEFPVSSGAGAGGAIAEGGRAALPVLLLVVAVALALLVVVKETRRRARYIRRDARSLARAARSDLAGFLADQGVEVPTSTTPAELAALVEGRYSVAADGFARAVAAARYSPDGRREASRARHEVRDIERRLRHRLSLRARIRGLLSLRSLTA